jgi:putative alpha-1,2-mannosidase
VVKSMILDGQQGGLLPRWSHQNNETFVMPGDPGPIVVSSAHAFGIRDFDRSAALALMKKSVAGGIAQTAPIRGNQATYEANRFLPGNPSESLELAASDFAIAQFARAQGDTATHDRMMTFAQYWRSSFNSESSFIHPRNADGSWPWPLNPAREHPFVEGNAAQYSWMVFHNLAGVIALMGGPDTAAQRLDQHFTQLNGGTNSQHFYIGNEPEHNVPWVYHYTGRPASTSATVRRIMTESFTTGAGGLPGNDDLGATSAWYVWAAMGMYPVTPGADVLALHGALFPSIVIQRPGGAIRIEGGSAGSPFVQSATVNGTPTPRSSIRYGDIGGGATVRFTMGASPGIWGTGSNDRPPSFTDGAVPPPSAPDLGVNLARGKSVTGSAPCGPAETAAKVVDGSLRDNSKWCSGAGPRYLQVDLGSAQTVSSFVLKHAGLGAEQTGYNTGAFTIQTSTDGATWSPAVSVGSSRSSRTYHPVTPRTARHVRFEATTPSNDGDGAARIYEFEVYGGPAPANNLAR